MWVVGDATTCAELHPSKQLHATSKYSMLGGCGAAEDKGGRLVFDNYYTVVYPTIIGMSLCEDLR